MDELNNKQMILLTMFTSFVVSIATGIITVAMLQEAPPTITQTVNRVVEHTIERVVTGTTTEKIVQVPVTTVTKEQVQYQSEDALVVAALEKNAKRVVEIWVGSATSSAPTDSGVLVSRDGVIAVDHNRFVVDTPSEVSYPVRINGQFFTARYLAKTVNEFIAPVIFLKIEVSESVALDPVAFVNKSPRPGQTLIITGATPQAGVMKTIVTRITPAVLEPVGTSSPATFGEIVVTPPVPSDTHGSLVLNLDGQTVGIIVSDPNNPGKDMICPLSFVLESLNAQSVTTAS
jgi:hypothetical protein